MTARVNPWLVLVLVCLAQFMVILDATIVNVALPTIQQDLDMSDTEPAVDRQRLHADVRRLPPARRPRRRPRSAARRSSSPASFSSPPPRCSARSRPAIDVADHDPRPAGARRRARLAGGALDRDGDLQGRRRADEGARRLGRDRGRRRRRRPRCSAASSSRPSRGRGSSSSTSRSGSSPSSSRCGSCPSRATSTRTRASTSRARSPSPRG